MMTAELVSINQTMCGEMALGSSVEKLKDATAAIRNSSTDENCIGLPYEDHNYGQIPPKYPLSSLVTRSLNSNFKSTASDKMCMKPALPHVENQNNRHSHRNGLVKQNFISPKFYKKEPFKPDSIEVDRDVTRCICGFSHDDGYMISCDRCSVWQHIDCVNIDRNNIPDTYLCDGCNPRRLNKEEAFQLQAKKRNTLSIISEFESSGAESADDKDQSAVTYTAVQSTPTSLTITSNRGFKRTESTGIGRKRKRSKDDKRPGKKTNNLERKRSRSTSKGSLSDAQTDEQFGTFTWARNLKEWSESYREIDENHYTSELLQAVLSSSGMPANNGESETSVLEQLRSQLAKVQQLRNTVLAMEDIPISKPILEIKGSYMLSNQSDAAKPGVYKRPYPHLFFYNGFDGLEIVVDCRIVGNVARFLRRSCKPNSEVRHVIERSQLRLFVYSKDFISSGSEITIPFDFKYQSCLYDVVCGCGLFKDCPVYEFTNMRMERSEAVANSNKHSRNKEIDGRVSPLRLSISRISEHINGFPGAGHGNSNVADNDQDGINQENLHKKSREDRKIEFYIRAFERLEEKEKRKEQHQSLPSSVDTKPNSKDHIAPSVSTSISQPSTPCSTSNEDKISSLGSHPAKRANRRRSTKTGRSRHPRKGRTTSYEGVLSPTFSFENNDSNHSTDFVGATQDSTNMSSISEQNAPLQLIDTNSSGLATLESDADSTASRPVSCVSSNSDVFPIVTSQSSIGSVVVSSPQSNTNTLDTCSTTTTSETTPSVDEQKRSLVPIAPPPSEADAHEASTVTTSRPGKKKSNNAESTGNSKQDPSATSSVSQPCCTFKNWDYRPGIPNGRVRVGIGGLPRWKHMETSLPLKKRWLKLASEEDLIPKSSVVDLALINESEPRKGSHKKRLLRTYRESKQTSGASTESSQSDMETADNISIDQTEPTPNAHGLSTNHNDSNASTPGSPSPDHTQPSYTTIEYESLSEDEDDEDSKTSSLIAADAECSVEENKVNILNEFRAGMDSVNTEINPDFFPINYERDPGQRQSCPIATEDNMNVTSKKKVSIQEYLKRNKEQRKTSVTQQQSLPKPVSSTPSTIAPTSTIEALSNNSIPTQLSDNDTVSSETDKRSPSPVVSPRASPTPATSPVAVETSSDDKRSEDNEALPNSSTRSKEELISSAASRLQDSNSNTQPLGIQEIMDAFSDGALKALPPDVLVLFNDFIKGLPVSCEESPKEKQTNNKRTSADEKNKKQISDKSLSKTSAVPHLKETSKCQSASNRPLVERSNSSPSVRHSRHGGPSSNQAKKVCGSQDSSPSSRHSTPGNRKIFTSPSSNASPCLIRGHSGSSLNSHSPTPTIYDRRHRAERTSRDSSGGKSRHSSGTSDSTGKSPKPPLSDSSRSQTKHSGSSLDQKPTSTSRVQDLSPKVPSTTRAVLGQPIPSLARGPGTAPRVPQVVYTRRPSPPRTDDGSSPWDPHPRDPPSRSLKDVPYNRHNNYFPPRVPSPPLNLHSADRNSRDKFYDRYPPVPPHSASRPIRREDDPPHTYYPHPYPSDYRADRSGYYPPGPRVPGPVSFSPPDYYQRPPGYYPPPPQDYRR